ncbi:MAG TPA: hypothetical protein VL947_10785 [Cytophagales bacterium]|nr:hypothetical protein [Cytophagales bacterium]
MELFFDLLKVVIPSSIVLYGMYLVVKSFLNKDFEKHLVTVKLKNTELILPARLQAYERICLLLERVSPHGLLLRVSDPSLNSAQLQAKLLSSVREEFNHNLSQQVYMSDQAWQLVKISIEEVIGIINSSAQQVDPESRSIELAKQIFDKLIQKNEDPCQKALKYIKSEIQQVF